MGKDPTRPVPESIPVAVVMLNDQAALLGAAMVAALAAGLFQHCLIAWDEQKGAGDSDRRPRREE